MSEQVKTGTGENQVQTAQPQTGVMSSLHTALDQVTAKEYLQQSVFPKLEVALNTVSSLNGHGIY